jgi:hypothetical protein
MNDVMGGRNRTDFFRIKVNAGKTGWDVLDKLTTAVVAEPTKANTALSLNGVIGSTKPQYQESGLCDLEFVQYEAKDVFPFLDKVAVPVSAKVRPEKTLEDGVKFGGSGTSDEAILAISYLMYDNDYTPTKIFVHTTVGDIDKTSGSFDANGEDYIQPTIKLKGKAVSYTDLVVPKELYDATLVTVAADITIVKEQGYNRQYITKAA